MSPEVYTRDNIHKGITGTGIKIIALITMLIDHISGILLESYIITKVPSFASDNIDFAELSSSFQSDATLAFIMILSIVMRLIGRFAFPLFIFLLIEGFVHTRSVRKYAINLLIFAFISQLPFNLSRGGLLNFEKLNIFVTLLLGLLCIWSIKALAKDKKWSNKLGVLFYISSIVLGGFLLWLLTQNGLIRVFRNLNYVNIIIVCVIGGIIGFFVMLVKGRELDYDDKNRFAITALVIVVFGVLAKLMRVEYGPYGLMAIVLMYLYRENKSKSYAMGVLSLTLLTLEAAMAFIMIPVVKRYNGKRGMKINKYFFYAFYPAHITILCLITLLLGWTTFSLY